MSVFFPSGVSAMITNLSPLTLLRMNGLAQLKPILARRRPDGSGLGRGLATTQALPLSVRGFLRILESKNSYLAKFIPQDGAERIEWFRRKGKETGRRGMECPGTLRQPVGARGVWSGSSSSADSSRWSWPTSSSDAETLPWSG